MIRRTALKPPTVEQVRAWQRRARRPLRRVGAKTKRERESVAAFRVEVKANARGLCEGFIHEICADIPHGGTQAHHVWPEDRDAGQHDAHRGAWLCSTAHRWVHDHPYLAAQIGLLRSPRFTDPQVPGSSPGRRTPVPTT